MEGDSSRRKGPAGVETDRAKRSDSNQRVVDSVREPVRFEEPEFPELLE